MTDSLQVVTRVEGKLFYAENVDEALVNCQTAGYNAIFMPQIIDNRIDVPKDSLFFANWLTALSVRATGKTKQNNAVVVYAHVPNYFSNSDNIATAKKQGLLKGAGIMPQDEFQRLLDLEDNVNVFVVDYNTLKSSSSGVILVKNALSHPQTIPFIGGRERAEKYLEKYVQVYGKKIGIWYSGELNDKPVGRLLYVGYYDGDGRNGSSDLGYYGRFVGVRNASAEGARENLPKLEQILNVVNEFVAPVNANEINARLEALYK
ncbi:MAG: hypothetical protein Q8O89_04000 [Nanoarchaeota archaeon]|nr:hypothetical protein [Nanoarchaeota archaeon]